MEAANVRNQVQGWGGVGGGSLNLRPLPPSLADEIQFQAAAFRALPNLWEGKINTSDEGKVKTQGLCFAILILSPETGECLLGLSAQASEHLLSTVYRTFVLRALSQMCASKLPLHGALSDT